jgi:hypothetical protein
VKESEPEQSERSREPIAGPQAAGRPGPEQRVHQRKILMKLELVAPYEGRRFPDPEEFFEVQCFDISVGGISFFLAEPPTEKRYLLALGDREDPIYAIVEVRRVALTKMHTIPVYLVGCRFEERVKSPRVALATN